jgi:hypothetical protein
MLNRLYVAACMDRNHCALGSQKNFRDLAFVIDSAPQVHLSAANRDKHFVETPFRCRLGSRRADPPCDLRPDPIDPTADRLIPHIDPRFSQDILDISQTKCEPQIKPDCALDDVGWKAIAAVADLAHPPKLSTFRTIAPTNLTSPSQRLIAAHQAVEIECQDPARAAKV